jgi:serine protease Do
MTSRVAASLVLGILIGIGPFTIGCPLPAGGAERRSAVERALAPMTFAAVAAAARSAVVTLRVPGSSDVTELPVDDWVNENDEELGADSPDFGKIFVLEQRTLGTAIIVHPSGIALTTARVVRLAPAVEAVTLDGRRLQTTVVGLDDRSDIAVLRLGDGTARFPYLPLADSDHVRVGDWVIAVGAPYGLEGSVTAGIISATARSGDPSGLGALLQTDAEISGGYAGGPLVNMDGDVVGLTTGGNEGIGFAIPANTVKKIYIALLERGRVRRGWLGIAVQPLTPDLALAFGTRDARGLLIADVAPHGPAALAGMRPGDVVRELDGQRLERRIELDRMLDDLTPGRSVTVELWQREREARVVVTLGEEPDERAASSVWVRARQLLGVDVQSITADMGVIVGRVEPGGPGAKSGLRRGDVIRELNHQPVRSVDDFEAALKTVRVGVHLPILLQRGPASLYVLFTMVPE